MRLWISDEQSPTHRLVRINAEPHGDYTYLGDLDEEALEAFLLSVNPDIDSAKNIQMLDYFGYLHLFVIAKQTK